MNQKGKGRESAGRAEGHRGWSGGGPQLLCCSSVGNPRCLDAERRVGGAVVWVWEDLAELAKITCQYDRRLSRSQN